MHPVEQDSGYHIFVIPGLRSGIFGQILMIFGQILIKLFVPFVAGDAFSMAGPHTNVEKSTFEGYLNFYGRC